MNAVIYARCSPRGTAREALAGGGEPSIEVQLQTCRMYCTLRGLSVAREFSDPGVSGGTPMPERPAGAATLEVLRGNKTSRPGALVILRLDRAFRSALDCLSCVDALNAMGVALHIVDMGGSSLDSVSPTGRLMLTVLAAIAEMERGMIRERTKAGLDIRRRNNQRTSRFAPYGWQLGEGTKKLTPVPAEQEVVEAARRLAARGMGVYAIGTALKKAGHRPRTGDTWHHDCVRRMVRPV